MHHKDTLSRPKRERRKHEPFQTKVEKRFYIDGWSAYSPCECIAFVTCDPVDLHSLITVSQADDFKLPMGVNVSV